MLATAPDGRPVHFPDGPGGFAFDGEVAAVFDDMARRSLPGYAHLYGARLPRLVAAVPDPPRWCQVWDMGASTGRGLLAVRRGMPHPYVHYAGVDRSAPMRERCQRAFPWAEVLDHDLTGGLPPAMTDGPARSAVVLWCWTLQFLPDRRLRADLLRRSADRLVPGGVMVVAEKWTLPRGEQEEAQDAYIAWRRDRGYTAAEIEAKTAALAGVMDPWSPAELEDVLAGCPGSTTLLYKLFNFGAVAFRKEA